MHKFQSYPSDTRRNNNHDVEAFWRKNDVIIKSCARWDFFITCSQSALKTKPGFLITRNFCLFVCLFVFARCCSPCYHHYILYTCLINKYERFCHTTMPWIMLLFRNFASLNIVGVFFGITFAVTVMLFFTSWWSWTEFCRVPVRQTCWQ